MNPSLNSEQIKELIPHRSPILLVDKVTQYTTAQIKTERTFTLDDPAFSGHFPDYPILPGVFIVEAMAQSAAILVNLNQKKTAEESIFVFMNIEKSKFRAPVQPGNTLKMDITQTKCKGDIYQFQGIARVAGKEVSQTTFMAKWLPKE